MSVKEFAKREKGVGVVALGLFFLAVLFLYVVALWFGALNQDEGWYLYAGRLVTEGKIPFVDFASTQGPLMAFIYALAQPFVRGMGVAGGRLFTAMIGLLTLLGVARLAWLVAREKYAAGVASVAALLAVGMLGLNLYHVYFTTIVKTYSIAGLFVVLGFIVLQRALVSNPDKHIAHPGLHGFVLSFISAGLFALAAGVRLSAGILLPAIWLSLAAFQWRRNHRTFDFYVLSGSLMGGSVVLLSIYVPLLVMAPVAVKFGLLEYHSGRDVGSAVVMLAYKGGFVTRLIGVYFPLLCMAVAAVWVRFFCREEREVGGAKIENGSGISTIMLVGFFAVSAVHLLAAFPYDDYQVFIMPVLSVVVAVGIAPYVARGKYAVWVILVLIFLHSVASPMLQSWFLAKRDRIWWPLRSETALQRLRYAAKIVKDSGGFLEEECGTLLTQDTYLAVESGLKVPPGMELGPFCYFPDMDSSKARLCHVLNREMMREILESGACPVAAFSGYGLAIKCPEVARLSKDEQIGLWKILKKSYQPVLDIEDFGQADTTLRILKWSRKK